ncbi:uncharacterized protein J4E79_008706 [Alternaria viburni]|uniref:uncharacterized protein n=1 Tax=Alternaria viburni TaxID=566460 RepID=UPI0020C3FD70|nr:uncharacterized protein J4E79_008706 [Alternaria viburni]KAI4653193.1 hypothetical protein J4E79_008706 [Alternaria viburni]
MGHMGNGHRRYRNIPFKIDGIGGTRYATMGGYIVVTDKNGVVSMYGLTAGHSIVQDDLEEEIDTEQANEELNAERNLFPDLTTEQHAATKRIGNPFK